MDYKEELKNKILNGEKLSEKELQSILWNFEIIHEIEGCDHRWQKEMQTIFKINDQLYAIDWMRGLTECQENDFYDQPYKVNKITETKTITITRYERVCQ